MERSGTAWLIGLIRKFAIASVPPPLPVSMWECNDVLMSPTDDIVANKMVFLVEK